MPKNLESSRTGLFVLYGLALSAVLGCRDRSLDKPWNLEEERHLYRSYSDLPPPGKDLAIYVPLGIDRTELALSARGALTLQAGAEVLEPPGSRRRLDHGIVSAGFVQLADSARVGVFYSLGPLQPVLDDHARVDAYARSAAGFTERAAITIGADYSKTTLGYIEAFTLKMPAPRSTPQPDTGKLDIAPGYYQSARLDGRRTFTLHGGTYKFDSLSLGPLTQLEIDNTREPVYISVSRSFFQGGTVKPYVLMNNILISYSGDAAVSFKTPLRVTFLAPHASVTLAATREPHIGAVFADSITLEKNARIEHRTFAGWDTPKKSPRLVCARCALLSQDRALSCCNELERASGDQSSWRARCRISCVAAGTAAEACATQCQAAQAESSEKLQLEFDRCMLSVPDVYSNCEKLENFEPATCASLGHPPPRIDSICDR